MADDPQRLADDLILVQLVPDRVEDVPEDSLSIRRRVGEIGDCLPFEPHREMQAIHAIRALADARSDGGRLAQLILHRIGPPGLELFEQGNGVERARAWLQLLHAEGRRAGRLFIGREGRDIGVRETLDIAKFF